MKADVRCKDCWELLAEGVEVEFLESHIVQAHSTHIHCEIQVELSGKPPGPEKPLIVECLACEDSPKLDTTCPTGLVGALTLCFHTSHEGHRMRIQYGDRVWESPERKRR